MNPEELKTAANDLKMLARYIKEAKGIVSAMKHNAKHCAATGQKDCVREANKSMLRNRLACIASHAMGFAQLGDDEASQPIADLSEHLTAKK